MAMVGRGLATLGGHPAASNLNLGFGCYPRPVWGDCWAGTTLEVGTVVATGVTGWLDGHKGDQSTRHVSWLGLMHAEQRTSQCCNLAR